MNPDFTLIWPLSCLKDGNHLYRRLVIAHTDHDGSMEGGWTDETGHHPMP